MSSEASDWAWRARLPVTPKLLLLALADGADFDGTHGGSIPHLQDMTGLSERAILTAMTNLENAGLLSIASNNRLALHLAVRK